MSADAVSTVDRLALDHLPFHVTSDPLSAAANGQGDDAVGIGSRQFVAADRARGAGAALPPVDDDELGGVAGGFVCGPVQRRIVVTGGVDADDDAPQRLAGRAAHDDDRARAPSRREAGDADPKPTRRAEVRRTSDDHQLGVRGVAEQRVRMGQPRRRLGLPRSRTRRRPTPPPAPPPPRPPIR